MAGQRAPISEQTFDSRSRLWRNEESYEFRHHRQSLQLPTASDQVLKLHLMRPAKGRGFCDLRLGDVSVDWSPLLLEGRYDDLNWMRATAHRLSELLELRLIEDDMGSDC